MGMKCVPKKADGVGEKIRKKQENALNDAVFSKLKGIQKKAKNAYEKLMDIRADCKEIIETAGLSVTIAPKVNTLTELPDADAKAATSGRKSK